MQEYADQQTKHLAEQLVEAQSKLNAREFCSDSFVNLSDKLIELNEQPAEKEKELSDVKEQLKVAKEFMFKK